MNNEFKITLQENDSTNNKQEKINLYFNNGGEIKKHPGYGTVDNKGIFSCEDKEFAVINALVERVGGYTSIAPTVIHTTGGVSVPSSYLADDMIYRALNDDKVGTSRITAVYQSVLPGETLQIKFFADMLDIKRVSQYVEKYEDKKIKYSVTQKLLAHWYCAQGISNGVQEKLACRGKKQQNIRLVTGGLLLIGVVVIASLVGIEIVAPAFILLSLIAAAVICGGVECMLRMDRPQQELSIKLQK